MAENAMNNPATGSVPIRAQPGPARPLSIRAVQASVQQQMGGLAERLARLLDALPRAGLVSQAERGALTSGEAPFPAILTGHALAYSSPAPQATESARLDPGTPVIVYQVVTGESGPTGDHWYLLSPPAAPPLYLYAGWAQRQTRTLHQVLQQYFEVAKDLCDAAAADRLETWAASKEYSTAIAGLERDVNIFEDACKRAPQQSEAEGTLFWRRRARLYRRSLKDWQSCLGHKDYEFLADQTACGSALYRIRGRLALAGLKRFDLLLLRGLEVAIIAASAAWIGMALLFLDIAITERAYLSAGDLSTLYTAPPIFAAVALAIPLFAFTRPSISVIIGCTLASATGKLRAFLAGWLRYLGAVEIPLLIVAAPLLVLFEYVFTALTLAFSDFSLCILDCPAPRPPTTPVLGGLAGLLPPMSALLVAIGGLIFPFTVSAQVFLFRALKGTPEQSPEARRSALTPAWKAFLINSSLALAFVGVVLHSSGAPGFLGMPVAPFLPGFITWRQVIYLGLLLLLYGLLIEWPYHQGAARWKAAQAGELALSRKEVAEQIPQSTSASSAQSSAPTLQDRYALWQYYRAREQEVADESTWSLTFKKGSAVSLSLLILSFVFEHLDTLQKALNILGGQK